MAVRSQILDGPLAHALPHLRLERDCRLDYDASRHLANHPPQPALLADYPGRRHSLSRRLLSGKITFRCTPATLLHRVYSLRLVELDTGGETFLLATITTRLHAALPYLDASLACFSLVASWWQARRNIANWWLWIVVDLLYVGEYIYKDLWLTAVLYLFLVGLAIIGLWEWRKAPEEPQLAS
jgi:hypothetical protein